MGIAIESGLTRIVPPRMLATVNLRELWAYRELIAVLTWRDLKVRYRQTVLGAAWAIVQPVLAMVVFSVFFGRLARMPSDGLPYPVFAYAALVPWTFFANTLTQSANSMVASANLLRKVYFPRLALPLSALLSETVDFCLAFAVLIAMMIGYGVTPTWNIVWLPLLASLTAATAAGVGLWLAALNVRYRDVRYVIPFLIQMWLFATPVAYPSSLLPREWQLVYAINPMVGVVEGFRWALLGTSTQALDLLAVSSAGAIGLLVSGVMYFRQMERSFADVI